MDTMFNFRRPRLALAAMMALAFVAVACLWQADHIEKFGFLLGSGLGIYFIVTGGKAIRNQFGNLAVLMFFSGLMMLAFAIFATPAAVFIASSLEDLVPAIVGAIGGMFTTVEDEHETMDWKEEEEMRVLEPDE